MTLDDYFPWADSIIALERQAERARDALAENVKHYFGTTPRRLLIQTLTAIAKDAEKVLDNDPTQSWFKTKRTAALRELEQLGLP